MAVNPSGNGSVIPDGSAVGGYALRLYSEAEATASVSGAGNRLVVRTSGAQCDGPPQMRVRFDGAIVGTVDVPGGWINFTFPVSAGEGSHQVGVAYTNDYVNGCDRDLYVDAVYLTTYNVETLPAPGYTPPGPGSSLAGDSFSCPDANCVATGDGALEIFSNGESLGWLSGPGNRVVVRARGEQCSGAPVMIVTVDGVVLGSREVVNTAYADFSFLVNLTSGNHAVGVTFANEYSAGCTRKLFLERASAQ
jgi:hypothetical protein